jgi:hypothetical protein
MCVLLMFQNNFCVLIREVNENGEMTVKPRRRTLESQLSKFDDEDAHKARTETDSRVLLFFLLIIVL